VRYYTVTEGRANRLDRLRLRDRSTYGLDWIVLYATSNADAIRQWEQFKSGGHLRQDELEAEAAQYRAASQGYAARGRRSARWWQPRRPSGSASSRAPCVRERRSSMPCAET
jgi:hypothetical protein